MEDLSSLSKMKVAELKKHLKMRGLNVSGNKNELIERLQASLENGDSLDSSEVLDDGEEEIDEEAILGNTDVSDIAKITPQEEDAMLMGTMKHLDEASGLAESTTKPKISLKRSEPCLAETPSVHENGNKEHDKNGETKENEKPAIKKIKLDDCDDITSKKAGSTIDTKTAEERKAARLARFGPVTDESKPTGENISAKKKRAERFGEITAKDLQKTKLNEAILKRKERFGDTKLSSTDPELEERKKKRAERFGL